MLVTKQTLCTGAAFSGSHLSHKEATASRCLQCDWFLWGGTEAKKTSMCFHALEKVQKAPEKDLDEVNPGNPRMH